MKNIIKIILKTILIFIVHILVSYVFDLIFNSTNTITHYLLTATIFTAVFMPTMYFVNKYALANKER